MQSESACSGQLSAVRDSVLRRRGLRGAELRSALTQAYDGWLAPLCPAVDGLALVAVGGFGRGEMAPYSDLDLVLLHNGHVGALTELADSIWYPIWDGGIPLDHSVRTVDEAVSVARHDLKAMLGLLDIRHLAGDPGLTESARGRVRELWRATATDRSAELRSFSEERAVRSGETAFLLEPNLKQSRGGLRDGQALHALAIAQIVDVQVPVRNAYAELLNVRGELHRRVGRADDVLRLQEQDAVARALAANTAPWSPATDRPATDRPATDRPGDDVLRRVNLAGCTIGHALDTAWRRVAPPPRRRRFGRSSAAPERTPLARDVVSHDGEVVLARDASPRHDPGLVLRAARAAAENGLPFADFALARLASEAAAVPVPWPERIREDFVALLGAGKPAVSVLESLDVAELLTRLIPEWDAIRCKAQHNPVHRFTVDRHLLETATEAATMAGEVDRPDLLLVGALLHDIGKGYRGDHSVVGATIAGAIATRMGFPDDDAATIASLAAHHLLLPDTATRRDLDDPATIGIVTDAVAQSDGLLELLYRLTIADAAATGPAAWSSWKAGLVAELVRRAHEALRGEEPELVAPLDADRRALAEAGELAVVIGAGQVIAAVPDRIGALYRTAGVLALNLLDVRAASIRTHAGMAVNSFVVEPRFGKMPDPVRFREELIRVLDGDTGLAGRLRDKERTYARSSSTPRRPATVLWFDDVATEATVLEYRAADEIGLLCRVTAALERCQLDVRSARVSSVAGSVVDAFYLTTRDGGLVPVERRSDVETELRNA